MKVLFLGCLFNQKEEKYLMQKSKIGLQGATNTYQWNIIKGLDKTLERPVDILNVLPVGTFPKYFNDLMLKTKKWSHLQNANDLEIGSINVIFLKQIKRTISCKMAIKKWLKDNHDNDKSIIIYSTYLPFLQAIKKLPDDVNITLIVTDIPEYYDLDASNSWIKKLLRLINNNFIYKSLKRIDNFVILTEQMKELLSIGKRPYIVIEGLVDSDNIITCNNEGAKVNKKIILYTGTLNFKFGIMDLINGFSVIDKTQYELWICGSGEAEKEIINRVKSNSKIKFLGYITKKEIYDLQKKATVLINPRTNYGEYTKYSFPSKTMEYMLSGTPVLMYKLDGIPDEYDPYLYYINGNQPKNFANRIMEICEKPQSELDDFGKKARQFVLENKNCMVQAKKIIDMINETKSKNDK